jgi:hypothetical protein
MLGLDFRVPPNIADEGPPSSLPGILGLLLPTVAVKDGRGVGAVVADVALQLGSILTTGDEESTVKKEKGGG